LHGRSGTLEGAFVDELDLCSRACYTRLVKDRILHVLPALQRDVVAGKDAILAKS
jgi:hypothetical protein